MTKEDITNAVRIFFSHRGIKLFKNEPHKKYIRGKWTVIKDLGYPAGSPDTIGWNIRTGVCFAVEIKTINDTLSQKQKDFLTVMIKDNCHVFIAKEEADGKIHLTNWKTKDRGVIE